MTACNGRYLSKSVSDSGFIFADSELGDFTIDNLLTPQADLAWRGDSTSAILIQLNLKQFELIDTLALCLHNMTTAATITVDFYDSRVNAPLLTVTEPVGGADTIPAYKNKILSFQEVSVQGIDITISDLDNPDGHIQIRRLKMGVMTAPNTGFDFGSTFGFVSGEQYRGGEIAWMWKTEDELNDVNELIRDYGVDPDRYARTRAGELLGFDDDILWIGYPQSTNSRTLEQSIALVALVGADIPFRQNSAQGVFKARFEEIFHEPTIEPGTAFITTWRTTGAAETITLPATGVNSFVVDWGDGSAKELVTTASPSHEYAVAGDYVVSIEGICRKWYQNNAGDKTKIIELGQWGDVGFTDLKNAFYGCTAVDITATDTPDVSAIQTFTGMFKNCSASAQFNVARWNVSLGSIFTGMFSGCSGAAVFPVGNWDVSSGLMFNSMFVDCWLAGSFPVDNWNVSSGTHFTQMFDGCFGSTSFPVGNWNVSIGLYFGDLFSGCWGATTFPVGTWDVSSGLDFSYMFNNCRDATSIPVGSWNVSSGLDFNHMFYDCDSVTTEFDVSLWNVSSGIDFSYMFYLCDSGATFPVDGWVIGAATDMAFMFSGSALGNTQYDTILAGWAPQVPLAANYSMNFGTAKYSTGAVADRLALTNDGITITDGGAL